MRFVIEGAQVVLPDSLAEASVWVEDGRIAGIGDGPKGLPLIDGQGLILAPAMIDIHGDAFERQVMPRPGVMFPLEAALLETDRQLATNGIATAYHALTLSWEPGLRSVSQGYAFVDALARLGPRLTVENRVQLRWETFCPDAIPLIERALQAPHTPAVAFNDHTSMAMLTPDIALQDRPFDLVPDFPTADPTSERFQRIMAKRAARADVSQQEMSDLIRDIWSQRGAVPDNIAAVSEMARAVDAPMLSHDDSQIETRDFYRARGAMVSEFPMQPHVAKAAESNGDHIVFGAPNAVRGGSHLGSPGAADMIAAGLCDVLASDYYYPSMLAAVARLMADDVGTLPKMWPLVSSGPARAMKLADRGEIVPGLRADLVLIDWPMGATPAVVHTFVAGRTAYQADRPTA